MKYFLIIIIFFFSACSSLLRTPATQSLSSTAPLGVSVGIEGLKFRIRSQYATRVQVFLYKKAYGSSEIAAYLLEKSEDGL